MSALVSPARPSLRRLTIFEATVRHGSAGAAAAEIGLSQPAVTHALSKLEQETGARLLDRGAGGSSATDLGALLNRRIRRMIDQIRTSLLDLTGRDHPERHGVMLRNLTDAHLRCHLAIIDHGSFRGAAAALGLAEPTLHRTARGLEATVGEALYQRGPRGIMATPAAIGFGANLRLALKEVEQGLDELAVAQGSAGGRLSIGCLPLMPKPVLAKTVGELLRRHPNVAISLEEGSRDRLTRLLSAGGIDILLGALRPAFRASDLNDQHLFADPYVLVVGADHALAPQETVSLQDLAAFPWIIPWRDTPRREVLEALFAQFPTQPKIVLETSSLPMMSALLAESACITILSQSQTNGDTDSVTNTSLVVLPVTLTRQDRAVGITTRSSWLPTHVQADFIALLGSARAWFPAARPPSTRSGPS